MFVRYITMMFIDTSTYIILCRKMFRLITEYSLVNILLMKRATRIKYTVKLVRMYILLVYRSRRFVSLQVAAVHRSETR